MMSHHGRHNNGLLALAMIEAIQGKPIDELVDQYFRGMLCQFCRMGVPEVNGKHSILGIDFDCDAVEQPPVKKERPKPIIFKGRGIRRRI